MTKNNFDQMDNEFNNQIQLIHQDMKQNKEKVIDFIFENIMNVGIELPENIKKGTSLD